MSSNSTDTHGGNTRSGQSLSPPDTIVSWIAPELTENPQLPSQSETARATYLFHQLQTQTTIQCRRIAPVVNQFGALFALARAKPEAIIETTKTIGPKCAHEKLPSPGELPPFDPPNWAPKPKWETGTLTYRHQKSQTTVVVQQTGELTYLVDLYPADWEDACLRLTPESGYQSKLAFRLVDIVIETATEHGGYNHARNETELQQELGYPAPPKTPHQPAALTPPTLPENWP